MSLSVAASPSSRLSDLRMDRQQPVVVSRERPETGSLTPSDLFRAAKDSLVGANESMRALPTFLYPSVTGSAAERAIVLQQLDRLPLKDVSAISGIRMVDHIGDTKDGIIMGVTQPGLGDMRLSRVGNSLVPTPGPQGDWSVGTKLDPTILEGTVTHEIGHCRDFQGGSLKMLTNTEPSSRGPWGKGPFVSDYATTNNREDFAETYANQHLSPQQLAGQPNSQPQKPLQDFSRAKYDAMQKTEQLNFMQRLVDRPAFRETGRAVGDLTSALPFVRQGLFVLGTLSTVSMVSSGLAETVSCVAHHDRLGTVHAALTLGAGLGLGFAYASPVLGPAALACLGASRGMALAERAAAGAGQVKPELRSEAAAAVGGALGGIVGGVAGPLGGTWLGYQVAGPIGGVAGLIAGSVLGLSAGSSLGARAGLAVASQQQAA
jgi:hypothetical protein